MKTGNIIVEIVTIYCPECSNPYEMHESGVTDIQEGEFEGLPRKLECPMCDAKFLKPRFEFDRRKSS